MDNNWAEVVDILQPFDIVDKGNIETVKSRLEGILRMLGWKVSDHSMELNFRTQFGKSIDVLLTDPDVNQNVSDSIPIFVRYTAESTRTFEEIVSILDESSCPKAILFNGEFRLIYKGSSADEYKTILSIPVDNNSVNGPILMNQLQKDNFDSSNFNQFYQETFEAFSANSKTEAEILSLIKDKHVVSGLIKEYAIHNAYDATLVYSVLSNIDIVINFKGNKTTGQLGVPKKLDHSKFWLDDEEPLNKRRFVLRVIEKYINEHDNISLEELEKVFPSKIISKKRGVVRRLEDIQDQLKNNPDLNNRYFLSPDDIITLKDGTKVVVNNQWGSAFPNFLKIAKKLYHVNSDSQYVSETENHNDPDGGRIKISLSSLNEFSQKRS